MEYHILNGDALKSQLPLKQVSGELIVMREYLIEGPVDAPSLSEFHQIRSKFISSTYGDDSYDSKSIPELLKIEEIENGVVNLWFEEDLFCQTNLWYVCSRLYQKEVDVYLIKPKEDLEYGFGGLNESELEALLANRIRLTQINVNQLALLWFAYRRNDIERLLKLGVQMHAFFPFIMKAIEAHFERLPNGDVLGKPERIIQEIIDENPSADFGTVFKHSNRRLPIYGYGDLQIKKIYDKVIGSRC